MSEKEEKTSQDVEPGLLEGKNVSRRQFLKFAGIAGATVGMGAGLGGLVAACGGGTTTTSSAPGTTGSTTATTSGGSTTSVSAVATGREIKIGFVTPLTGGLASFGVPDSYCVDRAKEAIGGGIVCGDCKKHPITIVVSDSQSDSNRAAQVTGDLINNSKCDIIVTASTPDTVAPVSDQCEANGVPCLSNDCPWQPYIGSRSNGKLDTVFKWTYHTFWGLEDVQANFLDMWGQVPNNKQVSVMLPNDADGNAWRPGWANVWAPAGLKPTDPGAFQDGTEDYTAQITTFKKAGCEIGMVVFIPPDFTNFYKQAIQQGYKPPISTYAKALLFPQSVEAFGAIANGLTTEVWWTPSHPFTSALLGETCQQFADKFTAAKNQQWTQPLLHFIIFEWAIDVLKRTASVDDKNAIMTAVKSTKLETVIGPVDFSAPVEPVGPPWPAGPGHVVENVYKINHVSGQWVKGTKLPFELVTVANSGSPTIPIAAKEQPYTAG